MIPEEKKPAVDRALREAFGVTEFDGIQTLKNLASSLVFRLVVRGSPFLLKISTRTSDPARLYACMKIAAEAGLAPRVRYASVPDRLSIEDFVVASPFPASEALLQIPAVLRRLHALTPFACAPDHINTSCTFLLNRGPALDAFLQRFQAANILPEDQREELFAWYAQLTAACPRTDADMVSSHNDLFKPDNMLFDGRRVWLVDWEAAFLNDRYADLAVVANMLVTNEEDEMAYLQEYFGRAPDGYQRARFFLMQQVAHMFYAMAFLLLGSAGKPIDWNKPVPGFSDFQRRMWAGELNLSDKETKVVYGRIHWDRLRWNAAQTRFSDSLRITSDRHVRYHHTGEQPLA